MNHQSHRNAGALLVLVFYLSLFSWPRELDARGSWRSNQGDLYRISSRDSRLEISVRMTDGQWLEGSGFWVHDGESFAYQLGGLEGNVYAIYRPEHDALEVNGPKGTSWLRRHSE